MGSRPLAGPRQYGQRIVSYPRRSDIQNRAISVMRVLQDIRHVLNAYTSKLYEAALAATVSRVRAAVRDSRGVAAVEFAVIAPVLFLLLIAAYEVSRAISLDRRFHLITTMTGDLVSREQDMGANP